MTQCITINDGITKIFFITRVLIFRTYGYWWAHLCSNTDVFFNGSGHSTRYFRCFININNLYGCRSCITKKISTSNTRISDFGCQIIDLCTFIIQLFFIDRNFTIAGFNTEYICCMIDKRKT